MSLHHYTEVIIIIIIHVSIFEDSSLNNIIIDHNFTRPVFFNECSLYTGTNAAICRPIIHNYVMKDSRPNIVKNEITLMVLVR